MDFAALHKVEAWDANIQWDDPTKLLAVIVKVKEPGYRPSIGAVRMEISPRIFTADITAPDLVQLDADAKVEAISLSRPIPMPASSDAGGAADASAERNDSAES